MVYLLYGTDDFRKKETIEQLKKENQITDLDIEYYDLENTLLSTILESASSMPLFQNKKMILVENANLFSTGTKTKEDITLLEEYIEHKNPNTILLFCTKEEKIDTRKKISKILQAEKTLIECKREENKEAFIKNYLKGYSISPRLISTIVAKVGDDFSILTKELDKLMLYKIDTKTIEEEDLSILSKTIDTDIFKFIDAIILKNHSKTIEVYEELIKQGEEPILLNTLIASQVRLLYQVKELSLEGKSEKEISDFLEIHPYRVKLAREKSARYKASTLLSLLEQLADLDYQMKSGDIAPTISLELFLLAH